MPVMKQMKNLLRDEQGATAIEYGLIASLIVISIIGAMSGFASESSQMWGRIQAEVEGARDVEGED